MSVVGNTSIAISNDKTASIQDIIIGNTIETFNYSAQNGLSKGNLLKVEMSNGTGNTPISQDMINIRFGDNSNLICSPDQKILTGNGKLTKADHLIPNDDLFLTDGTTTKVLMVVKGTFKEGVHIISTSLVPTNSLEHGNLFSANGIIIADFALNMGESDNGELQGLNPE